MINENMVFDAEERAYNMAHEAILAASNGDKAGSEALCKVFAIEIETILNMALQCLEDNA